MRILSGILMLALGFSACQKKAEPVSLVADPATEAAAPALDSLAFALRGDWRSLDDKSRDRFRHPEQTLDFCQVQASGQVAEVWPGSGWYSQILLPWVHANQGHFTAVIVDPDGSERAASLLERYLDKFSDQDRFGSFSHAPLSTNSQLFADANSLDTVLTFRNVHSWMGRGMAEKAFADFYDALKPGGILCVIEHRMPSSQVQNANANTGYVQEALVKALAHEAGFTFEAASEINANPKDTADHPFGVWTLKPVQRSPRNAEEKVKYPAFDRAALDAIGESDRMTLRFRKPQNLDEKE